MPSKRKRADAAIAPCGTTKRDEAKASEAAWRRAPLPDVTCAVTLQERLVLFWLARWGHLGIPAAVVPLRLVRGPGEFRLADGIYSLVSASAHFVVMRPSGRYRGFCAFFGDPSRAGRLCLSEAEWWAARRLEEDGYLVEASNSYARLLVAVEEYMQGVERRYECDCGKGFSSEAALNGHFFAKGLSV